MSELCRIAGYQVFITSPNWTISRCQWQFYLRKYAPKQLENLLRLHGRAQLFKGKSTGVHAVRPAGAYHVANALCAHPRQRLRLAA